MAGDKEAIPIQSLPLPQLNEVKQNLEQELQVLTSHLATLKFGAQCFSSAKTAVAALTPETEGSEVLVPMTSSVYVPGKLVSVDRVLVDVGTGYHIEKSTADAGLYCEGKVSMLQEKAGELSRAIAQKRRVLEVVVSTMNAKMAEMKQAAPQTGVSA